MSRLLKAEEAQKSITKKEKGIILLDLTVNENNYDFETSIVSAVSKAKEELSFIDKTIVEKEEIIKDLTPECDKLDYALAASSGALCGIIDIFLVGKPGESPLGKITDKWFANRTRDFARLAGWRGQDDDISSAIAYLERKFKIPYDQRGMGDAGSIVYDLNAFNHHFKSLAHNPSLLGLFFSIIDQFTNQSHFVSDGDFISVQKADDHFELVGNNIPAKLFAAITNWFCHLVSDMSGSSGSKGRGMGIPSPLWDWANSIIALKSSLGIPKSEFDKNINDMALKIFTEGYDVRFQTTQAIPVFINELVTRLMYSVRRLIKYFKETDKESRSAKLLWEKCEPFANPSVKRMLTVAHGTFCLLDLADATVSGFISGGGNLDPKEFILRLNIVGIGRFAVSLYGEANRGISIHKHKKDIEFLNREKTVIEFYMEGLNTLSKAYDDSNLLSFVEDFQSSDLYESAFQKTVELAKLRKVPENEILKNKKEIDEYFNRRNENE